MLISVNWKAHRHFQALLCLLSLADPNPAGSAKPLVQHGGTDDLDR
jgi:hypothetical protein